MPAATTVFENFGEIGLHRAMSTMKGQLKNLSDYVTELAAKHNLLVDDTAKSLEVRKVRIYAIERAMQEMAQ